MIYDKILSVVIRDHNFLWNLETTSLFLTPVVGFLSNFYFKNNINKIRVTTLTSSVGVLILLRIRVPELIYNRLTPN